MTARPCRQCGAPIALIQTPAGKWMPVDAGERVTLVTDDGQVVTGRVPHWATCTGVEQERKQTGGR